MRLRRTTTGSELDEIALAWAWTNILRTHKDIVWAHHVPGWTGATNECPIVCDVWFDLRVGPGYPSSGFNPDGPVFG